MSWICQWLDRMNRGLLKNWHCYSLEEGREVGRLTFHVLHAGMGIEHKVSWIIFQFRIQDGDTTPKFASQVDLRDSTRSETLKTPRTLKPTWKTQAGLREACRRLQSISSRLENVSIFERFGSSYDHVCLATLQRRQRDGWVTCWV